MTPLSRRSFLAALGLAPAVAVAAKVALSEDPPAPKGAPVVWGDKIVSTDWDQHIFIYQGPPERFHVMDDSADALRYGQYEAIRERKVREFHEALARGFDRELRATP